VPGPSDPRLRDAFIALVGEQFWEMRLAEICRRAAAGPRAGQAIRQRHAIELIIERPRYPAERSASPTGRRLAGLAGDIVALAPLSARAGRDRLAATLRAALTGDATLVPVFHLMRIAALQRQCGFAVRFAGLQDDAPFDLLLSRDGVAAEFVEDTDRGEWRSLRHMVALEGEARRFLTCPGARAVVAITCASRFELFGLPGRTPPRAAS